LGRTTYELKVAVENFRHRTRPSMCHQVHTVLANRRRPSAVARVAAVSREAIHRVPGGRVAQRSGRVLLGEPPDPAQTPGRSLHRRQFLLELGDPESGNPQFGAGFVRQANSDASVDLVLFLPSKDRCRAHLLPLSKLVNGSAGADLGGHHLSALRRIRNRHQPYFRSALLSQTRLSSGDVSGCEVSPL